MPERSSYIPGTPSWVDVSSPDPDASGRFYAGLLGWEIGEGAAETGGYRLCTVNGKNVAGLMPVMSEDQPVVWSTYVDTADADATTEAVGAAGGQVLVPPMDVLDLGRMAVFLDAEGAAFGCWQAGTHTGAQLVNEPGTLTWNELNTRDPALAEGFYASVFGWTAVTEAMGPIEYTTFRVGDEGVAGMMVMDESFPAEVPPNWLVYFAVADCDGAVATCAELGGSKMFGPVDIAIGRFAVLADPFGAPFAVIQMTGA